MSKPHTTPVRNARNKATVYDVAELAGVSIKTVSRVVNCEPNVRAVTQERVNRAIAALDYLPSEAARLLADRRSLTSL
ncbi:MAG: LacI family DNA-binding transcriptional regulator [Woeseiaceae bacterium]|nr:LacI family DNA-binding transcriptional regulator [Woeseiaceae bacterium]